MTRFASRVPDAWRLKARHVWANVLGACARLWRPFLNRVVVIGITGSVGKTTAKDLAGSVLKAYGAPVKVTRRTSNGTLTIPRLILGTRRWHRHLVIEAGAFFKGDLRWMGKIVRPQIAAITAVRRAHYASFKTLEQVAEEKQSFLEGMRPGGVVWLNGDDPHVSQMKPPAGVRARFFGTSPEFDLWADNVSSTWPSRLSFDAHYDGQTHAIETQLVGTHWLPSALTAIGIALQCEVALPQIAQALARVEPNNARLKPVRLSNGAVMLRDEFKSSETTLAAAFEVLRDARGVRRWVVFEGIEDTPLKPRERMTRAARRIPEVAEAAIFLGDHGETGIKRAVDAGLSPDMAFHALDLQAAARILREHTRTGDLILLKGTRFAHLTRIYFAMEEERFGEVRCWRRSCKVKDTCDVCPKLHGS